MTDERRRNMTMIYGSLAYDLDTLARERQLEEAGEMPERSGAPQPKAQPRRHPQAQAKTRPSPLLAGGIVLVCALVMVLLLWNGGVRSRMRRALTAHTARRSAWRAWRLRP